MAVSFPDPVKWAVPAFVVLVLAEMVAVRFGARGRYHWRDTAASLLMGFGSTLAGAAVAGAIAAMAHGLWQHRLFDIPVTWWSVLLCFVLDDLAYYWFHRTAHEVRWFWASHVIHHSSQHYNLSTALRQTWTGFLSLSFIFRLPLFLVGFDPALVLFVGGLNLIYQFWIHTEVVDRLPLWLEAWLNTPSHHRVHHGTNPHYLDRNYAGVFIIWDRMFGTFEPEGEAPRYGIIHNLATFNPLLIACHEWLGLARDVLSARTWRERWMSIAGPPGWREGSTAAAIKAAAGVGSPPPAAPQPAE